MKGLFIPEITAEMFRNGCLESIEALMTEGKIYDIEYSPWIPVSERLPEEDEWVLITFDNGTEIASLDDDGWCYSSVGNDDWIAEHPPVAWMPLPQPYKAESEDKQ